MARYIDADKLIDKMLKQGDELEQNQEEVGRGYHHCEWLVYDAPTEDVEPVVHGYWKDNGEFMECSVCGRVEDSYFGCIDVPFCMDGGEVRGYARVQAPYCRACGARMDLVEREKVEDGYYKY